MLVYDAGHLVLLQDPLQPKVMATGLATQTANDYGLGHVCLETDAMLLKDALEDRR